MKQVLLGEDHVQWILNLAAQAGAPHDDSEALEEVRKALTDALEIDPRILDILEKASAYEGKSVNEFAARFLRDGAERYRTGTPMAFVTQGPMDFSNRGIQGKLPR